MKRLLFFIILIGSSATAIAQVKAIKGKIADSESNEGIAYTNIGIEGTLYGTASYADGFFELKIPDGYEKGVIYFSAVGYTNRVIPVNELIGQEFVTIALKEQTYDIEDIGKKAIKLINCDNLKRELIEKGKERLKLFSWEKCSKQTNEVYEKVLNDTRKKT